MPNKINGYEIVNSIGSGAFGRTYRVKKGGKVYAMKVLKPEAIRTEVDRKCFRRECRALQKIQSKHVVGYHDHGEFDDDGRETYYIVMSFVEGKDFERRLQGRNYPLAEDEIRGVLSQVLAGLADIHEHGIVHRDLKPANIFVAKDGTVKIVDFGLVKMIDYTCNGSSVTPRSPTPRSTPASSSTICSNPIGGTIPAASSPSVER